MELESARKIVLIEYNKFKGNNGKKLEREYKNLKRIFLNCKGLNQKETCEKNLRTNSALYYAWKEVEESDNDKENSEKIKERIDFYLKNFSK